MRRAVLLFNPASGRRPHERLRTINLIAESLRSTGLKVETIPTQAPGTAGRQASEACTDGADIVFACGGDGTIHEILQGMAFQPHTALGIIPLGSANALARHLRLPINPLGAALAQLTQTPKTIPIGKVTYQTPQGERSRYFVVMAGADQTAHWSTKCSRTARIASAAQPTISVPQASSAAYASPHFPLATATPRTQPSAPWQSASETSAASSARSFAAHPSNIRTCYWPSHRRPQGSHFQHGSQPVATRTHRWNRYVRTIETETFHCGPGNPHPVQVQADGEWLGQTPMTVTLIPNGLRLLMPQATSPLAP